MSNSASPHRIVVVEDNPADLALLRQALDEQDEAYLLQVLRDGEEALRFVREHCSESPEPCLVVLDLHLPRYDGATVLKALREEPSLAHVSVVVLTTVASPAEREQILSLGVQAYLTKPMNWDETVELAKELIAICNGKVGSRTASVS